MKKAGDRLFRFQNLDVLRLNIFQKNYTKVLTNGAKYDIIIVPKEKEGIT